MTGHCIRLHGLLLTAALAFAGAAFAAPALPEPPPSTQPFGEANANCREWTNSCIVCRRLDDAERKAEGEDIACSTPGVACVPHEIVCRTADAAPPEPGAR